MFLHLSVSHSVHGRYLPRWILGYLHGQTPPVQTPPLAQTRPSPPPPTPADGMHPTGMHSYILVLVNFCHKNCMKLKKNWTGENPQCPLRSTTVLSEQQ